MSTTLPITVSDFKSYFCRETGFEFQPYEDWDSEETYALNAKVIGSANYVLGVYKSLVANNTAEVTDTTAWEKQDEEVDWILDSDIERAMGEALFKFNPALVPNEDKLKIISLYLTAFFVVYDRQAAASGVNGGNAAGPVIHRTVGKMSVSYAESKLFSKHPSYEFFARNQYGIKAFNLLLPFLRGNVLVLNGCVSAE